jgi:rhodanese-related sulfurtransferase
MKLLFTILTALTLGAVACANTNTTVGEVTNINEAEMTKIMAEQKEVIVIDVRTPSEVANGFIEGTDLFINVNGSNFKEEIAKLDKSKTYVVYCHSGARSGQAVSYMKNQGFETLYNLKGGISSWRDNSKITR